MKSTLLSFLCVAAVLSVVSCTKNSSSTTGSIQRVSIDTAVSSGALLSLNLSSYGNKAVITKQANNYATSTIVQGSTASPVFQFSSSAKVAGAEQVEIALTKSVQSGCDKKTDSTLLTVNLQVQ